MSTGRIATGLDRSPSAATEAMQRLAARGLLEHEPYEGVRLTDRGRAEADRLWECYQVLCRFCRDVLDLEWYRWEAFALVGIVSPDVVDRLQSTLLPPRDSAEVAEFGLPVDDA